MSNKDNSLSFTWDKCLEGEIAAAVAAQEARKLLPMGTSTLVRGGILFLGKTEVAAIVTHGHALGRLKIGETFVHVAKMEDGAEKSGVGNSPPGIERTPEQSEAFLKMAAEAIFVENPNTPPVPARRSFTVRLTRLLAAVFHGFTGRTETESPPGARP